MCKVTRLFLCFSFLLLVAMTARNAYADSFTLSWTGGYGPGSALLTATDDGGGVFTVTSITGTQNGASISGLVPQLGYGNNNYIYSSDPVLDDYGVAFIVGGVDYDLFYDDYGSSTPYYAECSSAVTPCMTDPEIALSVPVTSLTITAGSSTGVPEPSSLVLLFAGLSALLGFAWRKRSARSPAI
jgi:PEP-CTERM motif